jgi:hypothetical protein
MNCNGCKRNSSSGNNGEYAVAFERQKEFWPGKFVMIRRLKEGHYRLYSRKKNPSTGKRRNLGTFKTLTSAKRHERAVQFFKRAG